MASYQNRVLYIFFFFQAEDGIRDRDVTGVQTCALPDLVWLEPASVETALPEIDAALKAKEFFDVASHPRIAFASESVQVRDDRQLARGTLDIKGKRRNAEVPFRLAESGGKPLVSGSFMLDRLDYGIGTGEWSDTRWLGAEVKIDFSATLSRRLPLGRKRPGLYGVWFA